MATTQDPFSVSSLLHSKANVEKSQPVSPENIQDQDGAKSTANALTLAERLAG